MGARQRDLTRKMKQPVKEASVELSARNQLKGTVSNITLGAVMADVSVDIGNNQTVVSAITRASVERFGLKVGDSVTVIIKATEVMLGKNA